MGYPSADVFLAVMPWSSAGTISLLTTNWQYTDPIEGEYFRFKHFEAPSGAGYAIAQAVFLEDETVQFFDSQVLFYEKGLIDTLRLKKPEWATERRLGFKKFPRQPTFEEDLRRLLLPGFMQAPTQDIFNFVRKSEWRIDIEVSDYIESETTIDLTSITDQLSIIEQKIDAISSNNSGSTTPATSSNKYRDAVLFDSPISYWRLGETTGTNANDIGSAYNVGTYIGGCTLNAESSLTKDNNPSVAFSNNGRIQTSIVQRSPQIFSLEARFKTVGVSVGIIGFSNSQSVSASNFDRSIYIDNSGKVAFMVFLGSPKILASPISYNDGKWHSVVAILSPNGQELYIDESLVNNDTSTTSAVSYDGYWHIGFAQGNNYFNGNIDEVAIYNKRLSSDRVLAHYQAVNQ